MKNLVQQGAGARAQAAERAAAGARGPHSRNILHYTNVRTNDSTQSLSRARRSRQHYTAGDPRPHPRPPRAPPPQQLSTRRV